jgi:hypothetical protein
LPFYALGAVFHSLYQNVDFGPHILSVLIGEHAEMVEGILHFAQIRRHQAVQERRRSGRSGEVILILEAMKMQNELRANQSGIIKQINVGEGESVGMRQVLAVIE